MSIRLEAIYYLPHKKEDKRFGPKQGPGSANGSIIHPFSANRSPVLGENYLELEWSVPKTGLLY